MVRSAGTSGGPSKKKKRPLPARSNAASSLEESRQRYKVSTFGSSGPRTNSGLCRGLKSLQYKRFEESYQHIRFYAYTMEGYTFKSLLPENIEFLYMSISRGSQFQHSVIFPFSALSKHRLHIAYHSHI